MTYAKYMYTCTNYLAISIYISRFVSNLTNINHDSAVLSQRQWEMSETHNIFIKEVYACSNIFVTLQESIIRRKFYQGQFTHE